MKSSGARLSAILKRWLLPLVAFDLAAFLYIIYFPCLVHGDSAHRWAAALAVLKGESGVYVTDFWHPFLSYPPYLVLKMGWPGWTLFLAQLAAFFIGYVLLVNRLTGSLWARILAALVLLLPVSWNYAAVQSADTWLLIGLLWLLWGLIGRLRPGNQSGLPAVVWFCLDGLAMLCGGVLVFCTRYNAAPLILPLVLLPFLMGIRWRTSVAMVLIIIIPFVFSREFRGPIEMQPGYTVEILMAVDIVGIWKELHIDHPEAAPSFADKVDDWKGYFDAYDPSNHDPLVWGKPFFAPANIRTIAAEIRADYRRYLRHYALVFCKVKLRTFANPFGFSDCMESWCFRPIPDLYLDQIGIPRLALRPLSLSTAVVADHYLAGWFDRWNGLLRPWVWWLVWIGLLAWRGFRRRTDNVDYLVFLVAAAYFTTFFPFSNGFLLRYAFPVWVLFLLGSIRLLFRRRAAGG